MTNQEAVALRRERVNYENFEVQHPELRWASAEGEEFSSAYRVLSRRNAVSINRSTIKPAQDWHP